MQGKKNGEKVPRFLVIGKNGSLISKYNDNVIKDYLDRNGYERFTIDEANNPQVALKFIEEARKDPSKDYDLVLYNVKGYGDKTTAQALMQHNTVLFLTGGKHSQVRKELSDLLGVSEGRLPPLPKMPYWIERQYENRKPVIVLPVKYH